MPLQQIRRGLRLLWTDPRAFRARLRVVLSDHLVPLRRPEYRRSWRRSLRWWISNHQRTILKSRCSWRGVPAWKNPCDAWIYQEILHEVRPDVVVEIGSAHGGSTLYLADLLELLGSGIVLSLDIDHSRFQASHPRIRLLTGDSGSPETLAKVHAICAGKRVLVIHDGDHTAPAVLRDLRAYAPLVAPGSYLIVEDGVIDLFPPGDGIGGDEGPLAAVERFLREDDRFEVDESRERYLLTYNPRGFLRRTR